MYDNYYKTHTYDDDTFIHTNYSFYKEVGWGGVYMKNEWTTKMEKYLKPFKIFIIYIKEREK